MKRYTTQSQIENCNSQLHDQNHILRHELGSGGMGTVFCAYDKKLERHVALKQFQPEDSDENSIRLRFLREVKITAHLIHPAIVPVYALVEGLLGKPAYTMQVIAGKTLAKLIQETKERVQAGQPLEEAYSLNARIDHFLKVCDAMAYAHSKGVLHRDLKPANIMIGTFNEVYVVDWGLARIYDQAKFQADGGIASLDEAGQAVAEAEDQLKTRPGQLLGTPMFMSPEQARGFNADLDERSDLYSLGIILFQLVCLKSPFKEKNIHDILMAILAGNLEPLEPISKNLELPRELRAIIRKATALNPRHRYESVTHLSDDLRRFLKGQSVMAAPDNWLQAMRRFMRQRQELVLATLLLVLFGLTGVNFVWVYHHQKVVMTQGQEMFQSVQTLAEVAQQGYSIERTMIRFETLLGNMASAVEVALLGPNPLPGKYYLNEDFHPDDLSESSYYKDRVSPSWPVIKLAPGLSTSSLKNQLLRLTSLRPVLAKTILSSATEQSLAEPFEYLLAKHQQKLLEDGMPLLSAFVATVDGVIMLYPGRGSYPAEYDPRDRPWFQSALQRRGLHWSKPYVSSQKIREVLLGCSTTVIDSKSNLLAVVGIDLTLNNLHQLLRTFQSNHPWIQRSYLLDEAGKIIVQSDESIPAVPGSELINTTQERKPFGNDELIKKILNQPGAGMIQMKSASGDQYLAFTPLPSLQWYYVVESAPGTMRGSRN